MAGYGSTRLLLPQQQQSTQQMQRQRAATDREADAESELLAKLLLDAEVSHTGWAVCKLPAIIALGEQSDLTLGCGLVGRHGEWLLITIDQEG